MATDQPDHAAPMLHGGQFVSDINGRKRIANPFLGRRLRVRGLVLDGPGSPFGFVLLDGAQPGRLDLLVEIHDDSDRGGLAALVGDGRGSSSNLVGRSRTRVNVCRLQS